ncbi:hypothetical protein TRFO_16951 [Tritrichomonas foetus]|uniref:Uncharacterized protein n=1 Tax=Tritrichomonas foetus TaxID=1144522 RepID=A0A1J4KNX5_9EUKA|nr:hypothetical protein TRFO_16951 [Tritrichomonas foetus]|eukprot:OHT12991.1 hypothetical protein TRFO_16951 [Tritrichomonas foetus]
MMILETVYLKISMYHNSTLYPAIARILELLSVGPEVSNQIRPHLYNIREELQSMPKENALNHLAQNDPAAAAAEDISAADKRIIAEVKETMTSNGAIIFLEKLQNEHHLTTEKLKQMSVILAGKCGIHTDSQQFKGIDTIYHWFDENWDQIEPLTTDMLIVNCDSKFV